MSVVSNCNILTLTIVSILLLCVFGQKQKKKDDNLCPRISNVLCVKGVLLDISNAAKEINATAYEIEQYILLHQQTQDLLVRSINHEMQLIRSNLPTSKYHIQFNAITNCDKAHFIHLIKEENNAFSYLYNSINTILHMENHFSRSTDKSFKKILHNLQNNILCNYRKILSVYSEKWLSIDKISGIQILKTQNSQPPSFVHDIYSMIIARLLRDWVKNVNDFVSNIEIKFI